jgi:hypothetical protein
VELESFNRWVQMKSGTNDPHGTLYSFGRSPKLNAVSNLLTHTPDLVRNHTGGGSLGWAPVKDQVFHFACFEQWAQKDSRFDQRRMMTPPEAGGDFSTSRNSSGGARTIYDPWTSRLTGQGTAIRDVFTNNVIPQIRIDPTSKKFLAEMWGPNGPGTNITGTNNFQAGFTRNAAYHNISNRGDLVVTDNLKALFRFSRSRARGIAGRLRRVFPRRRLLPRLPELRRSVLLHGHYDPWFRGRPAAVRNHRRGGRVGEGCVGRDRPS